MNHVFKGPVLAIMLRAPLVLFWFSLKRRVYCLRLLFSLQTKALEFSTSQKSGRQEIAVRNANGQYWVYRLINRC